MDLDDDNIDSFIDMDALLNDPELNRELDLLQNEISKPTQPNRPTNVNVNNNKSVTNDKEAVVVQMDTVGLVDDTTLVLTAEDMEDPELLAQFNELNSTNDLPNTSIEDVNTPSNDVVSTSNYNDTPTGFNKVGKEELRSNDSQMSAEEAKRVALKFKREGNTEEALKWIRYAKKLENGNSISAKEAISSIALPAQTNKAAPTSSSNSKSNGNQNQSQSIEALKTADKRAAPSSKSFSSNTIVSKVAASVPQPVSAIPSDRFAPLEIALIEASRISLFEAKKLEKVDPQTAVARMREYKGYQQELAVLQSTRSTNGEPAAFRWEVVRKESVIENKELGEDQVELSIVSGHDLDVVLAAEKCTTISVSYNLGISSSSSSSSGSNSTDTGSTSKVRYADGRAEFNFKTIYKGLKRGRTVQQSYNRKKAVFQLVAHKGMIFTSTSTIGVCVVPLNDLLTKCCIEVESPLMAASANSAAEDGAGSKTVPSVKKSKTIGGTIRIALKVRSPLLGPQKVVSEEKRLVVGPWPMASVVDTPPPPPPPAAHAHDDANQLAQAVVAAPVETPSQSTSTAQFDTLTELEKTDPFSVDLLESNDVLENEIESTTNAITLLLQQQQRKKSLSEEEEDQLMSLQCRMPVLQSKLGILVFKVQSEALSFSEYIDMIKARLRRDQIIAVYLRSLQAKESNEAALKVFRRVKIMTEEVRNAEASS